MTTQPSVNGLENALNFKPHSFVTAARDAPEYGNLTWMIQYFVEEVIPVVDTSTERRLRTDAGFYMPVVDVEFKLLGNKGTSERVSYRAFNEFR